MRSVSRVKNRFCSIFLSSLLDNTNGWSNVQVPSKALIMLFSACKGDESLRSKVDFAHILSLEPPLLLLKKAGGEKMES